jgi:carbon starvation protein
MLFPFLFVTVACGACSGFHALVASGTTAKQLSSEKSIRPIAYGGMLLEGVLAMIALIGVAGTYLNQADYVAAVQAKEPVQMFASTIAGFCVKLFTGLGLDAKTGARIAESFMLLSVSAFLMTTVDAGTRLARFSWQELVAAFRGGEEEDKAATGAASPAYKVCHNMYVGTFVVVVLAAALLLGNPKAAKQLWTIFASANQLLASLTLLAATLWFIKNRKPCWMTAVPMVLMLGVSSWALSAILLKACRGGAWTLAAASAFLIAVAVALVCFAVNKFCRREK